MVHFSINYLCQNGSSLAPRLVVSLCNDFFLTFRLFGAIAHHTLATPGGSASTRDLGVMRREEHVGYLGTGVQARVAQGARRDTLAKRSRLRQQPAVAGGYAQSGAGNTEQMLSMLNQLTPDRRQRAADYVAQLLELQRAQEPGQPGARRSGVGGGPWAVRGPGNIAAAQSKAAMHVSGHMPGYNAAEPNVNFAAQPPQPSAPLSPLRLHALQPSLQPRPQEALDHMVTPLLLFFPPLRLLLSFPAPPPPPPPPTARVTARPSPLAPRHLALGPPPTAHRHP